MGFTEGKGCIGWGFGGDSHIGPNGGPFMTWVHSDPTDWPVRKVGSDALDRVGWWDDHIIPNPIFQIAKKEGEIPPTDDLFLANLDANGNVIGRIPWQTGAPGPSSKGSIGLMVNGQITHHVNWS